MFQINGIGKASVTADSMRGEAPGPEEAFVDFGACPKKGSADTIEKKIPCAKQGEVVREKTEKEEEEDEVGKQNDDDGENDALAGEIRLAEMDHAGSEREVKAPEDADAEVEDGLERLEWMPEIDGEPEAHPDQGVERDEVG